MIKGVMHSILVMIDGGDGLADKYTVDVVVIENNKSFRTQGTLHEDFFEYLLDVED